MILLYRQPGPEQALSKAMGYQTHSANSLEEVISAVERETLLRAVKEIEPDPLASSPEFHDKARRKAEAIYAAAVAKFLAEAEAEAQKKKRRRNLILLWLSLMALAAAKSLREISLIFGAPKPTKAELDAFVKQRKPFLEDFGKKVSVKLADLDEEATDEDITQTIAELEVGDGKTVSETEAQITYGTMVDRALKKAGYKTKFWQTMEDDRVRPTHVKCQKDGHIPIGKKFSNGLSYPGDPSGPPGEIINCRCVLIGGKK